MVGPLGIEPRLQDPQPCVLPLYNGPELHYYSTQETKNPAQSAGFLTQLLFRLIRGAHAFRARLHPVRADNHPLQVGVLPLFGRRIPLAAEFLEDRQEK